MKTKLLKFSILAIWITSILASQAYAQRLPEPSPKIQCSYDGKWYSLEDYKIYCKPPSPSGRSQTPPAGLKPEQQMQLMMMQSILQPFFNSLFNFGDLFNPPDTSSQQETKRQMQEQLKKEQEEKQKAFQEWLKIQGEVERARAAEEAKKREEGQKILAKNSIGRSSGGLTPFSWSTPQTSFAPISIKSYETKNFNPTEQLLCAAHFSKLAEGALTEGDLEGSRFYANQMDNVLQGLPTAIECKPPKDLTSSVNTKNALELNKKYTQMARLYNEVMPKIENLSKVRAKLDEVVKKKEESKKKMAEVEKQIEELKAKAPIEDKPEKKAETDNLLAQALALKAEAEKEHQEAIALEQKLNQEKENLEKEIDNIKAKYQEGEKR